MSGVYAGAAFAIAYNASFMAIRLSDGDAVLAVIHAAMLGLSVGSIATFLLTRRR